jgi:gliding motility-associated-like protein
VIPKIFRAVVVGAIVAGSVFAGSVSAQVDTEFWFAAPEISQDGSNFDRPIVLRITTLASAATVTVSQPANGGFIPIVVNIGANASTTVDLTPFIASIENTPANTVLNYGIRITSTAVISVYYENVSQQCLCNPEIFALKGMNAIGTAFIVPFQTFLNNGGGYTPTPYSSFDIVATENNTNVTITPTQNLVGHAAGTPFTITLNQGQTWSGTAASQAAAQHPSGTSVTSDRPIAITIKDDLLSGAPFGGCADLMGDQIVPIDKVGDEYIVMRGGLNGPDKAFVVGTQNGTTVTVSGVAAGTINAGQTLMVDINASSTYITASAPVYLLHLSGFGCEVGGALLPPIICTGSTQLGFTRSTNEQFAINLMTRTGYEGGFTINGNAALVPASAFQTVPNTNGDWMAAQIYFTTGQIAAGSGNVIANSLGKFHMGIIHGSGGGGTRYGYFSDFNALDPPIVAGDVAVCSGETLQLGAASAPGAIFSWIGPNSFTSSDANPIIPNISANEAGIYTVVAELDGCVSDSADVVVTVEICSCVFNSSNGGFEQPVISGCWEVVAPSQVPEWRTLSNYNVMEIWNGNCMGITPYEGAQFAEMDATIAPYAMDICTSCSPSIIWEFAHRGRLGVDVIGLEAGPPGGPYVPIGTYTDGNGAWGFYTGTYTVPTGQDTTRFLFTSISATGGSTTMGNLLDAVRFTENITPVNVTAAICAGGLYELPTGQAVSVAGTYTDTLTTQAGCDSVVVTTLTVNPLPNVSAGPDDAICFGQSAQLIGSGGISYQWSPASALSDAELSDPIATPSTTTDFIVSVTDANGCDNRDTVTINVNPLPATNAGVDESICINTTVQLNASGAASFQWSPATGLDNNAIASPIFSGLVTQAYVVTGTDINGCQSTDSITVTVLALPTVDAGNDTSICIGESLQLNASGAASYIWNPITDLNNPNIASPVFNGTQAATLTVTGTDAAGCVATADITINVNPLPTVDAGNDAGICEGQSTTLQANGAVSYVWSPGTALNNPLAASPIFNGATSSLITVAGTDANGCVASDDVAITVHPRPEAVIDTPQDACLGNATFLSENSIGGISSFVWTVSPGQTLNGNIVSHIYPSAGDFQIVLTVTDTNGCVHSDTAITTVLPLPQPDMNILDGADFCEDDIIQFTDETVGVMSAYSWNFNYALGLPVSPPFSSAQQNPLFSYGQFGTYAVRLRVLDANGCINAVTRTIKIHDVPEAEFTATMVCEGETSLLVGTGTVEDGSTVNAGQWDFGDGSNAAGGLVQTHTYASADTYSVQLITVTSEGCADTVSHDVWVNPMPIVTIAGNDVCLNTETIFINSSIPQDATIVSWNWDFEDGQTLQGSEASHTYIDFGTYTVTLTALSDSGCTATGTTVVNVFPNPLPDIMLATAEGCEPLAVPFFNASVVEGGSIVNYTWDFGDGQTATEVNPTHIYADTIGTFDVALTVTTNNGCTASIIETDAVTVNISPVADFTQNQTVVSMLDPTVEFTDASLDATAYAWTFGDGATANAQNTDHRYAEPGDYTIVLTVSNDDCVDSKTSMVTVESLFTFYIPNAFTPNSNGRNEVFRGEGEGYQTTEMLIYDRWGEQIFQTADDLSGWDGTFKGKPAPQGTYVYSISVIDQEGEKHTYNGRVTLTR